MKNDTFKHILGGGNLPLSILCLILIFFYNASFFGGDLLVSFWSAHQASLIEGSFYNQLIESWNLRGFGYKFIIYLNYKLINPWLNMFESPNVFNHVYRAFHSLFFLTTLFSGSFLLKNRFAEFSINQNKLLLASVIIFFSASFLMIGQPEEYAFIFTIWYLVFGITKNKILNWLSGLFVFVLFSLKVTTVGFLVFPASIFLYHRKKVNFNILFISGIAGVLLTAFFYFTLLKPDLKDVLEASLFQKSGILSQIMLKSFESRFSEFWIYDSFLYLGICISFLSFLYFFRIKQILIAFCFLSVSFVIFYQNKFFPYHFILFYPLAIYSIYNILLSSEKLTIILLVISLFFYFDIYYHGLDDKPKYNNIKGSSSYNWQFNYQFRFDIAQALKKEIKNPNEPLLFLTEGGINYFLPNPSYSRYFYPLPLQRIALNSKLKETAVYKNTLISFFNYKGEYVVWQPDWFNLDNFPQLKEYLFNNYEEVYSYRNYQQMKLLKRKKI